MKERKEGRELKIHTAEFSCNNQQWKQNIKTLNTIIFTSNFYFKLIN